MTWVVMSSSVLRCNAADWNAAEGRNELFWTVMPSRNAARWLGALWSVVDADVLKGTSVSEDHKLVQLFLEQEGHRLFIASHLGRHRE